MLEYLKRLSVDIHEGGVCGNSESAVRGDEAGVVSESVREIEVGVSTNVPC